MDLDELEKRLFRLICPTLRTQIKIGFNRNTKKFSLSAPIYRANGLPVSVKKYVEARRGKEFRPHETSFHAEEDRVELKQKIPMKNSYLRQKIVEFWKMAKRCHQMLSEIAAED
jgi:hypothetical protein